MTNFITADGLLRLLGAWLILSVLSFIFGRQCTNLTKPILLWALLRFLLAWVLLTMLGFMYGNQLSIGFFPYLTRIINLIQDDYTGTLKMNGQEQILLVSTMNHNIPPFVKGDKLNTVIDTMTMDLIMPLVMLFSLLIAWPVRQWPTRIKLLLAGIAFSFVVVALTVPFELTGANEKVFQNFAVQYHTPRQMPFLLTWAQFLDNGGAWARSIGIVLLGIVIWQGTRHRSCEKWK